MQVEGRVRNLSHFILNRSCPFLCRRYASVLLEKQQHVEAVELYSKAGRHAEAAKLLVSKRGQQTGAVAAAPRCVLPFVTCVCCDMLRASLRHLCVLRHAVCIPASPVCAAPRCVHPCVTWVC